MMQALVVMLHLQISKIRYHLENLVAGELNSDEEQIALKTESSTLMI